MADYRWNERLWRCARYAERLRWIFAVAIVACSRERAVIPDASIVTPDTNMVEAAIDTAPVPPIDAAPIKLEDRCKHHDDCVAIGLYPDGELRCCLACIPQRAANKTSADAFIAMCARERAMRECPVYDGVAPELDPKCVGRRCVLAPRVK